MHMVTHTHGSVSTRADFIDANSSRPAVAEWPHSSDVRGDAGALTAVALELPSCRVFHDVLTRSRIGVVRIRALRASSICLYILLEA